MTPINRKILAVLPMLLFVFATAATAQESNDATWSVTPYFWASDTTLDLTVEDTDINGGVKIP